MGAGYSVVQCSTVMRPRGVPLLKRCERRLDFPELDMPVERMTGLP